MVRKKLKEIGHDDRHQFTGEFVKYGYKTYKDRYSPTILLKNIRLVETNKVVTNHLWFNLGRRFQKLGYLKKGDIISFYGRVADYQKGYYLNRKRDWRITYPTKVKLLTNRKTQELPLANYALIGMIMNLNWDFYVENDRPIESFYLEEFEKWNNNGKLNIKMH